MGVKGLWSIVAPVGVRVNPEIFTGKRIAIDVSIWLYELTYANNLKVLRNGAVDNMSIFNDLWMDFSEQMNTDMRTDNLKKVHLYFFFLRICKLLYYNIRPIFIFDGTPPELKRKTIFQRNVKRRNHEEKFKKTAEKLIYNYYQRSLLASMKSRRSSSKRKSPNEGGPSQGGPSASVGVSTKGEGSPSGDATTTPPPAAAPAQPPCELIEIYDSIRENDASLGSMVEHIGNVPVSVKDVLNICNDEDLKKIQNKVLMITDLEVQAGGKTAETKGKELPSERKQSGERGSGGDNAVDGERTNDEDEYAATLGGEYPEEGEHLNRIDNEMDEEIVRKKHMARKKYYESIPKNFKGFLCMRRPVDIIDISNYSTDILEFTRKLGGEAEEAEKAEKAVGVEGVNDADEATERGSPEKAPHKGEAATSIEVGNEKQGSVGKMGGPDNMYLLPNEEDPDGESPHEEDPQRNPRKEEINVLELPPTLDRADLFHEGKDEYKVYYVNNEEIKIPLFKELNKEVFEKLPIKLQYQILQDIKEEWYVDNRVKAIKAKDDMDIFSQVQLETYVRMIKTDFEIEKLKIKMAENIQNVEGEVIINKELSKHFDSLSIRDYNDVNGKKKKKKKKKYINEILNQCYFEGKSDQYQELYIKGEEDEEGGLALNAPLGERLSAGEEGSVRCDQRTCIEAYGQVELARRRDVTRPKRELPKGERLGGDSEPDNEPENEQKALVKMEKEFKQDLLLDDEQLFGEDLLRVVEEGGRQGEANQVEAYQGEVDQVKDNQVKADQVQGHPPQGVFPPGAKKAETHASGESASNVHSSGDDFENCSVDEKEQGEDAVEEPIAQDVIDLTSSDEQRETPIRMNDIEEICETSSEPRIRGEKELRDEVAKILRAAPPGGENTQVEPPPLNDKAPILIANSSSAHDSGEDPLEGESSAYGDLSSEVPPSTSIELAAETEYSSAPQPISGDEQKIAEALKKVKAKVRRFISKEEINKLLLNKVDLGSVGKESYLENVLSNKVLLDGFGAGEEAPNGGPPNGESLNGGPPNGESLNGGPPNGESLNGGPPNGESLNGGPPNGESLNGGHLTGESLDGPPPDDRPHLRDSRALDAYLDRTNRENEHLMKEYKKLKKNNIEINEEMNEDIKILLNMFGIPYVQSPCEAEAQCSYLNCKNYCDAIISDDSDVLVFNGKTVIKNFFNRKKTVEVYERKLIEDKLGLYQDELINLSLLCGCDYTIGVHGVGIVNALEIIKAFPTFEDLKKLKEIVSNPFRDLSQDDKYFHNEEVKRFLQTHKNYKLNWIFPNNFPDREVYRCFKYPKVCTDIQKFQWHLPNLSHITKFLNKATNIAEEKISNVLNPILQKYDVRVRSYQLKIDDFFPIIERKRKSVDDLIGIIRDNQKGKRRENGSGGRANASNTRKSSSACKSGNAGGSSPLGRDITSLIDLNPAGVIRSKRMSTALDHIKGRGRSRKRGSPGEARG
ncbi:DNA repair endonuclease, putative [Plasmodium vivax]|uniref:DNA repair endonuclease, putative n=1 Tax=Plasmodium vivax (strain Salvador I) TaxID=126793 RepID=A5KBK9_PLAVS|nr:DNA repair endonuclease, putative [Plasmodium vivax]EDL43259.1 DNA repair endonuclease, putative [Plasmodium vivax]|eukprot:XP_001612986.1 DNA repair endonuclease [Plasmodium vivax Sal-1]